MGGPGSSRRTVFANALSLYVVHAANLFIPLVSFPYLVRVLGLERFGHVTYALGLAQLLIPLVDYSFTQTATREVATQLDKSPPALAPILSRVLAAKALLLVIALAVFWAVVGGTPRLREDPWLFAATSLLLVGEVVTPIWFLHGLQRMGAMSLATLGGRLVSLALLFALVRAPDDYRWAALVQAAPSLASGAFALVFIWRRIGVRLLVPDRSGVSEALRGGWQVFLGRIGGNVYTRAPIVLLGSFAGAEQLGQFGVGQRIAGLASNMVTPLAQSFFPRLSELRARAAQEVRALERKLLTLVSAAMFVAAVTLYLSAPMVAWLLTGKASEDLAQLIRFFVPVIGLTGVNVLLGTMVLAARLYREMTAVLWVGALTFVLTGPLLSWLHDARGMIWSTMIVEAVVLVGCVWAIRRARSPAAEISRS